MTLSSLKSGEYAFIKKINNKNQLDAKVRHKLLSLGILPNTKIKMVREAPLGGIAEYYLRGFSVGINKDLADIIEIVYA